MHHWLRFTTAFLALGLSAWLPAAWGQEITLSNRPHALGGNLTALGSSETKFEDFNTVTQGAKEYEGLFKLFHKGENLYAEIQPHQLDRPFLLPMAIARGMGLGGRTLNYDEQWVLLFRRMGDKIHLVRRNIRFQAKTNTPLAHAVETSYHDSILLALRIISINPIKQSILINLNDLSISMTSS